MTPVKANEHARRAAKISIPSISGNGHYFCTSRRSGSSDKTLHDCEQRNPSGTALLEKSMAAVLHY